MEQEKLVIYKGLGGYYVTPKSNYDARIQNSRLVQDCRIFDSVYDIIEYYNKFCGTTFEDFIIVSN